MESCVAHPMAFHTVAHEQRAQPSASPSLKGKACGTFCLGNLCVVLPNMGSLTINCDDHGSHSGPPPDNRGLLKVIHNPTYWLSIVPSLTI